MLPTAAWMATEMFATLGNELAIQLTPVAGGRYEIYLNGEKLWDKKTAPGRPSPSLDLIHDLLPKISAAMEAAETATTAD
jgi:predicted Rdx family selenoprotein